jgi:hypothetical protein
LSHFFQSSAGNEAPDLGVYGHCPLVRFGELLMNTLRYYVIEDEGGWIIQTGGENSDPFASRQDAVHAATALARLDLRLGRDAEIVVLGDDNMFHLEWEANGHMRTESFFPSTEFAAH